MSYIIERLRAVQHGSDRPYAASVAAEAADEIERLRNALEEIASETEVHTKVNQERLCCKFQHIARAALDAVKER